MQENYLSNQTHAPTTQQFTIQQNQHVSNVLKVSAKPNIEI